MSTKLRIVLPVVFLAAGCTVGPEYQRPENLPQQRGWEGKKDEKLFSDAPAHSFWWRSLNDETLNRLVDEALISNNDISGSLARLREARASRKATASQLLPQVNGGASYTRSKLSKETDNPFPEVRQDAFDAGFDASWEIDIFGGRHREIEAADAQILVAQEQVHEIRLSVAAEVARNYVELRSAQRRTSVVERNIKIQEDTLRIAEQRNRAQLESELDSSQARAQLERLRADLPSLHTLERASAYRLGVLTGRTPDSLVNELTVAAPMPLAPDVVPVGLPVDLFRRRPDVRRAEAQLRAATADVGIATSDLYPRFFITGSVGQQANKFTELFKRDASTWSIGPSIHWPIFSAGKIQAGIDAAEARREAAAAEFRARVLSTLEEVESALISYAQNHLRRDKLVESQKNQQHAVELAQLQYKQGLKNFLVVLDAQRQLNAIESDLAITEADVVLGTVRLYKALGGGWETENDSDLAKVTIAVK